MAGPMDDREYTRPPEEFPPPAAQMAPPPAEFGEAGQDAPASRKKRRHSWLAAALAAGLLSTVALFSDTEKAILEPFASPSPPAAAAAATPLPTALPSPSPSLGHTPSPSPVPAVTTPAPTPAPTATPKPTTAPATTPDIHLVFYRTSEVYHLQVLLTAPEKMSAVTVRMVSRTLQQIIWEHDLTEEEIGYGWYLFSDFDLAASEFVQTHLEQVRAVDYELDPILEVTCTANTDEGVQTFTKQAEPAFELWASARYDLKDPGEDFLSYFMEQTTYPDCFVVRIEDSPYGELNVLYGEETALAPGDVAVTLLLDGQPVPLEGCHLDRTETVHEGGILYAYAFVMPRPSSFPEEGTVEIRITSRLIHYPTHTKMVIKTVEY